MTTSPGTQARPLAETAEHGVRLLPAARYRHPGDVIRLIIAGLVLAGTLAVTITAHATYAGASAAAVTALAPAALAGTNSSFIGPFTHNDTITSTVPANGDVNPYGVAVVPTSTGSLVKGDVLVSNFNNSANQQGTGTTIVQISPGGQQTVFAQIDATKLPGPCPGGVGLTTALGILPGGWVVVGSLPTTDGTAATAQAAKPRTTMPRTTNGQRRRRRLVGIAPGPRGLR